MSRSTFSPGHFPVSSESGYWKFEKWKWKINPFHFFREMKSELKILFTLFREVKVKKNLFHFFSRNEKWNENPVHSFREWKVKWKCLEIEIEKWNFSRILEKFLNFGPNAFRVENFNPKIMKNYQWNPAQYMSLLCSHSQHFSMINKGIQGYGFTQTCENGQTWKCCIKLCVNSMSCFWLHYGIGLPWKATSSQAMKLLFICIL